MNTVTFETLPNFFQVHVSLKQVDALIDKLDWEDYLEVIQDGVKYTLTVDPKLDRDKVAATIQAHLNVKITSEHDDLKYLPMFAFPGGYPMFYILKDEEHTEVCPCCARQEIKDPHKILTAEVLYEGERYCELCGEHMIGAYED